jgi:N-methylhydantoinase A
MDIVSDEARCNLGAIDRFHDAHQRRYGYSSLHRPTEMVNLRVKAIGSVDKPDLVQWPGKDEDPKIAMAGQREVFFKGKLYKADLYDRKKLGHGNRIRGPTVVFQMDTTIPIPPGWVGAVDSFHNILLTHV